MQILNFIKIMFHIIHYNMVIFKERIINDCINFLIWGCVSTFVTGTLLSKSGVSASFATFQFCGVIANVGLWMSFHEIVGFITDIENKKKLFYDLSLPLPSYLFFASKVIFQAIRFIILTVIVTILSKLILYNIISLEMISIPKFIIIVIFASLFAGAWILLIPSIIKKSQNLSNLFSRIQFPLWFMGGFQFSWITLYESNKVLAYLDLLNPILYINEAFKNAILGIDGITTFTNLIFIITLFIVLFFAVGYMRLKKQLDFI